VSAYVALLRGINVAGHRRVPMAELRAAVEDLGCTRVSTYLQSGNVVFHTSRTAPATLATAIERQITRGLGLDVDVLVRTRAELDALAAANPFLEEGADATALHVAFLGARPPATARRAVDPERFAPDRFALHGREVYLSCPNGYGRSRLTNPFFERALGTTVTTRNWKTVTSLVELARG